MTDEQVPANVAEQGAADAPENVEGADNEPAKTYTQEEYEKAIAAEKKHFSRISRANKSKMEAAYAMLKEHNIDFSDLEKPSEAETLSHSMKSLDDLNSAIADYPALAEFKDDILEGMAKNKDASPLEIATSVMGFEKIMQLGASLQEKAKNDAINSRVGGGKGVTPQKKDWANMPREEFLEEKAKMMRQ